MAIWYWWFCRIGGSVRRIQLVMTLNPHITVSLGNVSAQSASPCLLLPVMLTVY